MLIEHRKVCESVCGNSTLENNKSKLSVGKSHITNLVKVPECHCEVLLTHLQQGKETFPSKALEAPYWPQFLTTLMAHQTKYCISNKSQNRTQNEYLQHIQVYHWEYV